MEIVNMPLNKLKPYHNNAKIHTSKQIEEIANSIQEFGFCDPIGIWGNDNTIVEGHGRYEAAKQLGIKEIPCIRLDQLSDEQRKAYTLAHNQTTLSSGFDLDILEVELLSIDTIDMSDFGFDLSIMGDDTHKNEEEPEEKENERERTNKAYNLDIYNESETDGFFQMPIIHNDNIVPDDLTGMNYMLSSDNKDTGIHMYVDDYQFERLWNDPDKYLDAMREYQCILSPDFSLYMDMPMAMKIWNVYRSRMLGNYWQRNGIKVIPTVSWAEQETYEFCFDGIPQGSIVSVSTIGVKRDPYALSIWKDGMKAMIEHIQPSMILVYGGEIDFDYQEIPVRYYDNKVAECLKQSKEVI